MADDALKLKIAEAICGGLMFSHENYSTAAECVIAEICAAGYAIVPKEPTEAMIKAGEAELFEHLPEAREWSLQFTRQAFEAMIEAARSE